jgi:hypothetical protein
LIVVTVPVGTKANPSHKDRDTRGSTKSFSSKKSFTKQRNILDADPCPIHDGTHSWGDCRANHYSEFNKKRFRRDNQDKKESESKKPAKSSSNFAVHSSDKDKNKEDEKMDNTSTKTKTKKTRKWIIHPPMDQSSMRISI